MASERDLRRLSGQEALNSLDNKLNEALELLNNINSNTDIDYEAQDLSISLNTGDSMQLFFGPAAGGSIGRVEGWLQNVKMKTILRNIQSQYMYKIRVKIYMWDDDKGDYQLINEGLLSYSEDAGGGFSNPYIDGLPALLLNQEGIYTFGLATGNKHYPYAEIINEGDDADLDLIVYYNKSAVEVIE